MQERKNPQWRIIWYKDDNGYIYPNILHDHCFISVGKQHPSDGGGEVLKIEEVKYDPTT